MFIENKFNFGDYVYIKTDPEQKKRMICHITLYPGNAINYMISSGTQESDHYEFELSDEIDVSMKLGLDSEEHA